MIAVFCFLGKCLPLNSDVDLSCCGVESMKPALHKESPLDAKSCDQKVEPYGAEAVAFQESHEEAEANKDHDMDVLEAWEQRVLWLFIRSVNIQ